MFVKFEFTDKPVCIICLERLIDGLSKYRNVVLNNYQKGINNNFFPEASEILQCTKQAP